MDAILYFSYTLNCSAVGLLGRAEGCLCWTTIWILNITCREPWSRWCKICVYSLERERRRRRLRRQCALLFFLAFESRPRWKRKPTQRLSSGDAPLWQTSAGLSSVGFGNALHRRSGGVTGLLRNAGRIANRLRRGFDADLSRLIKSAEADGAGCITRVDVWLCSPSVCACAAAACNSDNN